MIRRLTILLLLLLPVPSLAWWNCAWDHRFTASINRPSGSMLSNYQVRLNLNGGNVPAGFEWNRLGEDLRVIDQDDLTQLDFFIEQWDVVGQTAVIWVNVASLPGAGRTIYIYFGAPAGTQDASTILTFTEPGLKFHTRRSTANPANRAAAETAFDAASDNVNGYGCNIVSSYVDLTNRNQNGPPNRNDDIALFAEVFFEVPPGQAGVWQFRYGADFGLGGGLYVDDVALDEEWNDDLWWDNNWGNTSEILQGSISLAAGGHSLRILGFEDCCDGGLTAQFRRPTGPWLDVSQSNIALHSRKCPVINPTVSFGPGENSTCPDLALTRSLQTYSDPFNNTTNPKAIPGAVILNEVGIANSGAGAVDAGSVIITEAIAANTALRVADFDGSTAGPVRFTDGSPPSNLGYTFTSLSDPTDDVAFSNNNGASYNYSPVPDSNGVDLNVTNIRITPQNAFQGDAGGGPPTATFEFKTVVQ